MLAGSVACYSLSGAYAYKSNELKVTSTITTGDVDIAIQENQISEDGETLEPLKMIRSSFRETLFQKLSQ